jgi:RNA polymerase sigma-32 factor
VTRDHPLLRALDRARPLTEKEERALAPKIVAGDPMARRRLVEGCMRLVVKIARRHARAGKHVSFEDLVALGNVGLCRAALVFDPGRGVRFSTYAAYWIRAEILRESMAESRMVKVGTTLEERTLFFRFGSLEHLSDREIAVRLGISERSVRLFRTRMAATEIPLDGADREGRSVSGKIASGDASPEDQAIARDLLRRLELARRTFPLRNRRDRLVMGRVMADEEDRPTLDSLGEEMGVSRERVRQIEANFLARWRAHLARFGLFSEEVPEPDLKPPRRKRRRKLPKSFGATFAEVERAS